MLRIAKGQIGDSKASFYTVFFFLHQWNWHFIIIIIIPPRYDPGEALSPNKQNKSNWLGQQLWTPMDK